MNHAHEISCSPAADALNVVMIYQDVESGKRAKEIYDLLTRTFGADCEFTSQVWKLDLLRIGKLREMALQDARDADVIILSFGDLPELRPYIKSWFEAWANAPGADAVALVALFRDPAPTARITRDYLAQVAERARVACFVQPEILRLPAPALPPDAALSDRSLATLYKTLSGGVGG